MYTLTLQRAFTIQRTLGYLFLSTHGTSGFLRITNGRKTPQAENFTCFYFDLQDRLSTLNYPFLKQMKSGINLAATVDDNQSWFTLTGECERWFLRDNVTFYRKGRT